MKVHVQAPKISGFTLIEMMIVVAIVGLLAVIALPNFLRSSSTARLNSIYNNLRVVSDAKDSWALQNGKATGDPTDMPTLSSYFWHNVHSVVQETYVPNPVGTPAVAQLPGGVGLGPYAPGSAIPAP